MQLTPTICPYCGAGCGMLLVSVKNRVVGVEPWSRHPVSEGKLCIKGWNAHQFINHPDRLTTPLVRKGDRLEPSTWEEAVSRVIGALQKIKDEHGPDAVGFLSSAKCTNEENYVLQKLSRAFGSPNIDHCARL